MYIRREQYPGARGPKNVDRRKGFLDIVERLGQGVVAITPTGRGEWNYPGNPVNHEERQSRMRRTHRR